MTLPPAPTPPISDPMSSVSIVARWLYGTNETLPWATATREERSRYRKQAVELLTELADAGHVLPLRRSR